MAICLSSKTEEEITDIKAKYCSDNSDLGVGSWANNSLCFWNFFLIHKILVIFYFFSCCIANDIKWQYYSPNCLPSNVSHFDVGPHKNTAIPSVPNSYRSFPFISHLSFLLNCPYLAIITCYLYYSNSLLTGKFLHYAVRRMFLKSNLSLFLMPLYYGQKNIQSPELTTQDLVIWLLCLSSFYGHPLARTLLF
jgi:hypothetical protein